MLQLWQISKKAVEELEAQASVVELFIKLIFSLLLT
jgi:hypothetical protein